jgi:iron(III) transport system ATP-binding protein
MKAGRFLQVGTPQEIYDRPASEAVARFIGQGAVVPVRISRGAAVLNGVRFPVGGATGDGPAKVLIRPEAISATAGTLPDHLQGRVRDMFYRGGFWEASVVISDQVDLTIVHSTPLAPGQEVSIAIERGWGLPA